MNFGLLIILALVLILPFVAKSVEHNLEIFLFIMGLASVVISGQLKPQLFDEILSNYYLYFITLAVLIFGILFVVLKDRISELITRILKHLTVSEFSMMMIIVLGFLSSVITAIVAALILVEVLNAMPIKRQQKVYLNVIACFSIGLGAVLTPIGEPLATVVVAKRNADFTYLFNLIGFYIVLGVVAMGALGLIYITRCHCNAQAKAFKRSRYRYEGDLGLELSQKFNDTDNINGAVLRAVKIFFFVFALELLGTGFKPMIDEYVLGMSSAILYWLNMLSAVLDNATLAAAEISNKMTSAQLNAILMGLLVSGGMLIPGNIPNIITAAKMKITSREWARIGFPIGLVVMAVYFVLIFFIF